MASIGQSNQTPEQNISIVVIVDNPGTKCRMNMGHLILSFEPYRLTN